MTTTPLRRKTTVRRRSQEEIQLLSAERLPSSAGKQRLGGPGRSSSVSHSRSFITTSGLARTYILNRESRKSSGIDQSAPLSFVPLFPERSGRTVLITPRPLSTAKKRIWPRGGILTGKWKGKDVFGAEKASKMDTVSTQGPAGQSPPSFLPLVRSPTHDRIPTNAADTIPPGRHPETPPVVGAAFKGIQGASEEDRKMPVALLSPSRRAKTERQALPSNSEENGIFSWSDSQLAQMYTFDKEIGFGNWGSCWLAQSNLTSKEVLQAPKVAVKLVHRQGTPPSNARVKALWNEFKVLRSCGRPVHRNLVNFKEFIITPSYALIVMDYYQQTMNVALPVSTYAGSNGYFQQLLSSINWLHSKSVTHCDIKVANLLVDTREDKVVGRPILVDFGFATIHDPKTNFMSKQSWGTPEYLSPERSRADLHDERLSDMWALGVTFFEIATGRTPFEHEDEQFLSKEQLEIYYHRTLGPKWVGTWSIPPTLESLCRRMLTPNPKERILFEEALRHAFFSKTGEEMRRLSQDGSSPGPIDASEQQHASESKVDKVLPKSESDSKEIGSRKSSSTAVPSVGAKSPKAPVMPHPISFEKPGSNAVGAIGQCQTHCGQDMLDLSSEDGSSTADQNLFLREDSLDCSSPCEFDSLTTATVVPSGYNRASPSQQRITSSQDASARCKSGLERSASLSEMNSISVDKALQSCADEKQSSQRRVTTMSSNARPKTMHGTGYTSSDAESSRVLRLTGKPVGSPVELAMSVLKGAGQAKKMSYEIMADERETKVRCKDENKQKLAPSQINGEEKMEAMTSRVQKMQADLQNVSTLSPSVSTLSAKSDPHADELASRLDEMGILAANLARMVEETKSKLNSLHDSNMLTTKTRTKRLHYSVSSGTPPSGTRTAKHDNVLKAQGSISTATPNDSPCKLMADQFSPTSINKRKAAPISPGGMSDQASSIASLSFPFPTHEFSPLPSGMRTEERQTHAKVEVMRNRGDAVLENGGNYRATSIRGRALSHFLARYGSRNVKSNNLSSGNNENFSSKISAANNELGSSSEKPHNQLVSNRHHVLSDRQDFSPRDKPDQRPSKHFFDDDGVVKVQCEEVTSLQMAKHTSQCMSDQTRFKSASSEYQNIAQRATPHQSRVYQNHRSPAEIGTGKKRLTAKTSEHPPAAPSTAASRLPSGGQKREGRLSKMKSFTIRRSTSIQMSDTNDEVSLSHHDGEPTTKNKRNTCTDLEYPSPEAGARGEERAGGELKSPSMQALPLSVPLISADPPRHSLKSPREWNQGSAQPLSVSVPNTPGRGLWNRLFRGGNGSSPRNQATRMAHPSPAPPCV